MFEATLSVFVGALAALITDRVVTASFQLWAMRRIGRKFMKSIETKAQARPDRRAN